MATQRARFLTFNDPHPMRIDRDLALEIGLNESIVLLQIEYLIGISSNERDGKLWTYQSLEDLKRVYFPWWSIATLSRVIRHLEELELIHIGNYNKLGYDRTQWFALNEAGINRLTSVRLHTNANLQNEKSILQIDRIDPIKMQNRSDQNETTIPESTHEITQRVHMREKRPRKSAGRPPTQSSLDNLSEAVEVYKRLAGKQTIPPTTETLIASTVVDIPAWEVAIKAWCDRGFKPGNVEGMIDWYLHPEKQQQRGNTHGSHIRQGTSKHSERKPQVEADPERGF